MRVALLVPLLLTLLLHGCGHTPDRTAQREGERNARAAIERRDYAGAARIYKAAAAKYNDPADSDVKAELLSSAALWQAWAGNDAEALRTLDECAGLRRTITSKVYVEACETEKQELRSRTGTYQHVPRTASAGSAPNRATAPLPGSSTPSPSQSPSPSPSAGGGATTAPGGCPTSMAHIEPRLPRCTANAQLMELRRMFLAVDVSFREDRAQGYTYQQIAVTNSQAAIEFENSMKQNEQAMLEASADANLARARLAALRESPPRCDAGPAGSFGMGENAFQGYAASYIGAVANRAVAAVAACLARRAP